MAEKLFKISITTPEKTIFEGEISSLVAPGEGGYFGVLVDHAPLIANIIPGKITIKDTSEQPTVFKCKSTGILEVLKNNVNILVDSAERV
ncbi:MAG: ATP synthase F1 subunit epsilon [Candidatus Omnitrophica bacterium]|nr:ATP synthase F1 subunit epsilon [Candidatus Omnitrophota bacterium]MDD5310223.1 ATP synthase F1 subunit epsilon [Candidatus Omnitrophota bacterium]MDD5546199.1 ATP synthase F1 subunit epsilon [Candidatus Omnitrophota bacterium]